MNVTKLDSWHDINWLEVEHTVKRLRNQIFIASRDNDLRRVGNLQKVMIRSEANRLLAVRRVTQINKGHKTPGVDKAVYETPKERLELAKELRSIKLNRWNPPPTLRTYIPKGKKKRPLGIPTQLDRCLQTVVKNALEPFWEARFEHYSFGFRPGRSVHDAITAIMYFTLTGGRPWILDADIKGAFDHINHNKLLEMIGNFPGRFIIEKWLKAGVMEGDDYSPTPEGTPQGGVISPLLANIALHGMEAVIGMKRNVSSNGKYRGFSRSPSVIVKYADDFVVISKRQENILRAQDELEIWLGQRGLEMSQEKTAIRHITEGFDFLGFNVRQYERALSTQRGHKLLIRPSKKNVEEFKDKAREIFRRRLHHKPEVMIMELNALIRGWANYYRHCSSRSTFNKLDDFLYHRSWRYVNRRHPRKGKQWKKHKYFGSGWTLCWKERKLLRMSGFTFVNIPRLRIKASPDNPEEEEYWEKRRSKPTISLRVKGRLWRIQKGRCWHCEGILDTGEEIAEHHKDRNRANNRLDNLALIHENCHQQIHYQRTA